jgi:hypothetical protein
VRCASVCSSTGKPIISLMRQLSLTWLVVLRFLCRTPEQILNQVYWMYTKPSKLTETIGRDGFGDEGLEKVASSVVRGLQCDFGPLVGFHQKPAACRSCLALFRVVPGYVRDSPSKEDLSDDNWQPQRWYGRCELFGVVWMLPVRWVVCVVSHRGCTRRQKFFHELVRWRGNPGHGCGG